MNLVTIEERIRMLALCESGSIRPLRFQWNSRTFRVGRINGSWRERHGEHYRLHYSLQSGDETFFVHFSSQQTQWWLDQIMGA